MINYSSAQRTTLRHGFSEWDEWHDALPGHRLLACANYGSLDAPECLPSSGCQWYGTAHAGHAGQRTVMRDGWWKL